MTLDLTRLRELKEKSTPVVAWYAHAWDGQVRGPHNRWFQVLDRETRGLLEDEGGIYRASVEDDVEYAAAAMNALPKMLDEIERLTTERDSAHGRIEQMRFELNEASKAGTPYWKERDTMNGYAMELSRLAEENRGLRKDLLNYIELSDGLARRVVTLEAASEGGKKGE